MTRLPFEGCNKPTKETFCIVVALLYGYQWSMSEVAEYLGIAKGTVQTHAERGLTRLRTKLGVEL
jgi:DNA-directed RNA polymerase specialized sigma24 family protein